MGIGRRRHSTKGQIKRGLHRSLGGGGGSGSGGGSAVCIIIDTESEDPATFDPAINKTGAVANWYYPVNDPMESGRQSGNSMSKVFDVGTGNKRVLCCVGDPEKVTAITFPTDDLINTLDLSLLKNLTYINVANNQKLSGLLLNINDGVVVSTLAANQTNLVGAYYFDFIIEGGNITFHSQTDKLLTSFDFSPLNLDKAIQDISGNSAGINTKFTVWHNLSGKLNLNNNSIPEIEFKPTINNVTEIELIGNQLPSLHIPHELQGTLRADNNAQLKTFSMVSSGKTITNLNFSGCNLQPSAHIDGLVTAPSGGYIKINNQVDKLLTSFTYDPINLDQFITEIEGDKVGLTGTHIIWHKFNKLKLKFNPGLNNLDFKSSLSTPILVEAINNDFNQVINIPFFAGGAFQVQGNANCPGYNFAPSTRTFNSLYLNNNNIAFQDLTPLVNLTENNSVDIRLNNQTTPITSANVEAQIDDLDDMSTGGFTGRKIQIQGNSVPIHRLKTVVSIDSPGTGYAVNDLLNCNGGGGAGGVLRVTSVGGLGSITGVTIDSVGSGYTSEPTSFPSASLGIGASFTVRTAYLNLVNKAFTVTTD